MENNHQKPHAILFPYPLQGHVIPFVHLAIKLASKGFIITFVNTQSVHHNIIKSQPNSTKEDDIFAEARKSDKREDTIDYIPGVRAIEPKDLMSYLQATDDLSTVVYRIIFNAFEDVKRADFVVCNTVQELESETILALQEKQPIYAIGPLFPVGFTNNTVPTSMWSESDCTKWLSTKPQGSVLYVSFGSYAHVSKQGIVEIAYGLLVSGVSFIWAVRPDIVSSDETDFLPVGFEDETKGRGLIVPWCRQMDVISHPTVGGFLTHCGWNSILESIWCSVPLLCFPLLTDQFTNRKLVVDDWRIGLNLCDMRSITREEVARKINRLMSGKLADELRTNIEELKKVLLNSLTTHGSSENNFNQFINDVKIKIRKKLGTVTLKHNGPSFNNA
ncbi:udp-glycosyltransferase 86a1 [Quercus suber]|uniref:Udp-glycosyltransferase 86a1 n=1 Tax=Quercus suber TaxID=58331 RepID=A0AAW0IYN9_QUESU